MRRTIRRYGATLAIGIAVGFYVGARTTTRVLKDRIETDGRPMVTTDQLSKIRENLEEYQAKQVADAGNEWFNEHPIVQRLEREEAEADARASGKHDVQAMRERIRPQPGDTTLEELHRRSSKPGGV